MPIQKLIVNLAISECVYIGITTKINSRTIFKSIVLGKNCFLLKTFYRL